MMNKNLLGLLATLFVLTAGVATYLGIVEPAPTTTATTQQETVEASDMKIAFVNEDTGVLYNNQTVNIGRTLASSFDAKTDYPIEVVSRAIAERGLEDGTYQLMVVLPSKFSTDSLALESPQPTQVVFQYQIKSDKQLVIRKAEQAVSDLKAQFNKDLINIYFSSIIGNLQAAQNYVSNVVTKEEDVLAAYQNRLRAPLNAYAQLFSGVSNAPDTIRSTYASFSQSLHNTNDSFTSIININKTYDAELATIYGQQAAWQSAIDQREANLVSYDTEFSKLSVAEQLQQLQAIQDAFYAGLRNPRSLDVAIRQAQDLNGVIDELVVTLIELNRTVDATFARYDGQIGKAVEESLANTQGIASDTNTVQQTLGLFVQNLKNDMLAKLDSQLATMRLLDDSAIEALSLTEADKAYLKNVNRFIAWYATHNGKRMPLFSGSSSASQLEGIKGFVVERLSAGGTLEFPKIEGRVTEVTVSAPAEYHLSVEGYPLTQVSATEYKVAVTGEMDRLSLPYRLTARDLSQLNILSPAMVTASVETVKTIDVAEPKDQKETTNTVDKTTGAAIAAGTDNGTNTESANSPNETTPATGTQATVVYEPKPTEFTRTYSASSVLFPYEKYSGTTETMALFEDVANYLKFSGLVSTVYDIDLRTAAGGFVPGSQALIHSVDTNNLKQIIVELLKESTISSLKSVLLIPVDSIESINSKKVQVSELAQTMNGLKEYTATLTTQLGQLILETEKVHTTLLEKPEFVFTEQVDNADLVTVATQMNDDLAELMVASRILMENTQSNQAVSDSINQNLAQLQNDVAQLESEGSTLSNRVNDLNTVMAEEYADNERFLQSFANVLKNTKTGNEKNQAVYEYLSNPVDATNISSVLGVGSKTALPSIRDERSSFLIILISYVMSLALAYIVQNMNGLSSKGRKERVSWANVLLPMGVLSGGAFLSALAIFAMTGAKLPLDTGRTVSLVLIGIMVSLVFSYGNNLLLKRLKHIGFLVSIGLLLLYVVSAPQLFDVQHAVTNHALAQVSPLSYVEGMVQLFINNQSGGGGTLITLLFLTPFLGVFNAFLYREIAEQHE